MKDKSQQQLFFWYRRITHLLLQGNPIHLKMILLWRHDHQHSSIMIFRLLQLPRKKLLPKKNTRCMIHDLIFCLEKLSNFADHHPLLQEQINKAAACVTRFRGWSLPLWFFWCSYKCRSIQNQQMGTYCWDCSTSAWGDSVARVPILREKWPTSGVPLTLVHTTTTTTLVDHGIIELSFWGWLPGKECCRQNSRLCCTMNEFPAKF